MRKGRRGIKGNVEKIKKRKIDNMECQRNEK